MVSATFFYGTSAGDSHKRADIRFVIPIRASVSLVDLSLMFEDGDFVVSHFLYQESSVWWHTVLSKRRGSGPDRTSTFTVHLTDSSEREV